MLKPVVFAPLAGADGLSDSVNALFRQMQGNFRALLQVV
jgi:hypothetical protein